MIAKTEHDFEMLRKAGAILSAVLSELEPLLTPGTTTAQLDLAAEEGIRARGAVPAFLNYKPGGAAYAYPAVLCVSVNDAVVHGIPSEVEVLKKGDVVTIDLGLSYEGYFVDSARTLCVGTASAKTANLLRGTKEALAAAVAAVKAGGRVGDIGAAVEKVAKQFKLSIVEELGGHAVGKSVHEKPFIPNVGTAGKGEVLVPGLVIAIEPILTNGRGDITLARDQWTYKTKDGSTAAHFEQTIIVTEDGCEVLTPF